MLTGKTRYRTTIFGRMVLQVQEKFHHMKDLNGSGYYDEYDSYTWRDAKLKDFQCPVNSAVE